MEITIRAITRNDYSGVLELWNNELGNKSVNTHNISMYYEEMSGDSRYITFVARVEKQVVGFITSVRSLAVGLDNGFIHITGLAVKKAWQGKGIGKMLLDTHEDYAKSVGVTSVILNSGMKRKEAHEFYEKNGFSKDSYCFDKEIGRNL
jgi:GNAT superfamily N-acetyltransferase